MTRPRILFLTHRFPYPPNRGDRIRSFRLLEFMSKIADVDLVSLYEEEPKEEYLSVLKGLCRQTCFVPWRKYGRWLRAGASLLAGSTMTEGLFGSQRLRRQVQSWANNEKYDRVVSFCSSMYPYTQLKELRNIPLIVDIVDVDSQKWLDYAQVCEGASGLIKRPIFLTEGKRLRRVETEIAQKALRTLVVSEDEANLYRSFVPENIQNKIVAVSNGVDSVFFSPEAEFVKQDIIPFRLVFVGALDYRANLDGIAWFLDNIWQSIKEKYPQAELDLVGSNPGEKTQAFAKTAGVNLIGRVDDVRPYIQRAAAVTVPLRVARGIQNKVLEAMAMAKPVLATPMSLQGIDSDVTQYAYCCDSIEDWMKYIPSAFEQNASAASIRANEGRKIIVQTYSWAARFSQLSELIVQ